MALDLSAEQREIGKANFHRTVGQLAEPSEGGVTRRDFMKGLLATGAAVPVTAAAYFGYTHAKVAGRPVKAALIGAGDEGGVLVGFHNPEYLEFVAVCDIRPYNQKRIFTGDPTYPVSPRKGFNRIYGKDAAKKIKVVIDYQELLQNKDIEAVVIALPLNLHAQVAIDCMKAKKHVLCEKLMAWNINECKQMIKAAEDNDVVLSIGHQRHYSMLYAHALEVMNAGVLGDVRYIRALWHRNNTFPRLDKDSKPMFENGVALLRDSWRPEIRDEDRKALEGKVKKYGFKSLEELVRWRLYNRTGGGLMAELGSHQLDACSIFLGKVRPLAVSGIGGKTFYKDDREVEDHVFVTFEFPGANYYKGEKGEPTKEKQKRGVVQDKDDKVIVTYSSINTNEFENYGECIDGTRGTMIVEAEQTVMLYPEAKGAATPSRSTSVTVQTKAGGAPALDSSGTTGGPGGAAAAALGKLALGAEPPSRGYREEMEHFAYCIRTWNEGSKQDRPQPRCGGTAAMADAIIALTSNLAMRGTKKEPGARRIEFKPEWFDPAKADVPDGENTVEILS